MNIFLLLYLILGVYSFDMSFDHHNIVVYNSFGKKCIEKYNIPSMTFISSELYDNGICHKGYFGEYPEKDLYFYVKQKCDKNKLFQTNGCNEDCSSCTSSPREMHIYKNGPIACLHDFYRNISQSFAIEKTSQDSPIIVPHCLELKETNLLHRHSVSYEIFFYILAPMAFVAMIFPVVVICIKKYPYKRMENSNENSTS